MALPNLPSEGQDPWYGDRNNFDQSLRAEVDGRLSNATLDTRYTQINTLTLLAPRATGTDQSAALATAASSAATFGLWLQLNGDHILTNFIDLPSGAKIDGASGTIRQTGVRRPLFRITNRTGVWIRNLTAYGRTDDYVNTSAVYDAMAVYIAGTSSDIRVDNCTFEGFAGGGVLAQSTTSNIHVSKCRLIGPGSGYISGSAFNFGAGVTIFDGCTNWSVKDCEITQWAQGIVTGHNCDDFSIERNHIYNIVGQHGIYMRALSKGKVSNNRILNTVLQGMKIQITETGPAVSSGDMNIDSNIIINAGVHGILLNTTVALPIDFINITGNTINGGTGGDGIVVDGAAATNINVSNNMIRGTNFGIRFVNATKFVVAGNTVLDVQRSAYHFSGASDFTARDNIGRNPAQMGTPDPANRFGLYITSSTEGRVYDNFVSDNSGKMLYGVYVGAGSSATLSIDRNTAIGATAYGWRGISGDTTRSFQGNRFQGSTASMLYPPANFIQVPNATDSASAISAVNSILAILRDTGLIRA